MSDVFDSAPSDALLDRLAALGHEPVPSATQSEHLTAMAAVARRGSAWNRFTRRAGIVAAFGAGIVIGTTGLAGAGALGPLQPIVAKGVEAATPLKVPKGPSEKADKAKQAKTSADGVHGTARVTAGCVAAENGEFAVNRGQYLKQERAKGDDALAAAKLTDCGKPLADDDAGDTEDDAAKTSDKAEKSADTSGFGKGGAADDHRVPRCDDGDDATTADPKAADDAADAAAAAGKPACTPAEAADDQAADAGKPDTAGKPDNTGKPDTAGKPDNTGKPADAGS